jgi:hypothetical protein
MITILFIHTNPILPSNAGRNFMGDNYREIKIIDRRI